MTTFAATTNADAFSILRSQASASGVTLGTLSDVAAVALTVANILGGGASGESVPAGNVTNGTFGSVTTDVGIYSFVGPVGVGIAGLATSALRIGGTVTAVAGNAVGISSSSVTLVASANSDSLRGATIGVASFTPGAFTGLAPRNLVLTNLSTAAFTSPGDPVSLDLQAITGTGATNAFAIRVAPPTGATNNYLIAHTTPATFNVTAAGGINGVTLAATTSATITSASANALSVGLAGATNPAFNVDSSTASQIAGLNVIGAATGGTVAVVVTDSGSAANLTVNAKGTGTIGIGSVSTGIVTITPATTITGAAIINNTVQLGAAASANLITIGGTGYGAGVASVRFNGLTTAATNNLVGTLTNSPVTGNPTFWMPVSIAGVVKYIPCF